MNQFQQVIALLIRKYGQRVEGGAYEVHISKTDVISLSPFAQLQQLPALLESPDAMVLRMYPNVTIEGELPDGGPVQCAQADDQKPA